MSSNNVNAMDWTFEDTDVQPEPDDVGLLAEFCE